MGIGKDAKDAETMLHHVGISVADLEASIKWYGDMFGFEVEKRTGIPPINAKIAFMRHGGTRIELFEVPGAAPLPEDRRFPNKDLFTHGTKHFSFGVADVLATMEVLRARGADVAMENVMEGQHMAFIRDNSGNLIEINQAGAP